MKTFNELGIDARVLKAIEELGFERAMPVQEEVIPVLLEKETDLVALAQTGTGKTAAFGLPLINKIDSNNLIPEALILCPTRELCIQIANDLKSYAKYIDTFKVIPIYGGANIETQMRQLSRGVNVIVATPGRMLDLMRRGKINLSNVKYAVLDEADEMLDMGFQDELNEILKETPKTKNTWLFSATMPTQVERIARGYMNKPIEITVGSRNSGSDNVKHYCYLVHAKDRYLALKRIADYYPDIYAIIFCRTRRETQEVADWLIKDGYNADALHGDLSQVQRDNVMNKFRVRNLQMLVATDVAARGLDVNDLTHVINYNLPDEIEAYTHRSGRTGRADKSGISIAITNMREKHKIKDIERQIGKSFKMAKIPNGKEVCEKQLFYMIDKMEKVAVKEEEIADFLPVIYKKLEELTKEDLIKRFVSVEFNRFLTYYRNAPDLNVSEKGNERTGKPDTTEGYARLFINLGKMDGLLPAHLIGLMNDVMQVRDIKIGKIEILKSFSFFEVEAGYLDMILAAFKDVRYGDRFVAIEQSSPRRDGRSGEGRSSGRREGRRNDDRRPARRSDERKSFAPRGDDRRGGERKEWNKDTSAPKFPRESNSSRPSRESNSRPFRESDSRPPRESDNRFKKDSGSGINKRDSDRTSRTGRPSKKRW
ncbi:MAG: DEAD/DEAH box helicase [Bacteroidetes bacterium]|nr:DEAD/DEAH box helicase [Bacteroidota bacterium]